MRLRRSIQSLVVVAASVAKIAEAHPGHSLLDGHFGFTHYFVAHGGGMLPAAVVLGAGALVWLWNRRPRLRPVPARERKPRRQQRHEGTDRRD